MAFASSRTDGQEAMLKPCDICEDDEHVNWFCKNCFQNLCNRCKKMHPKIVSFKDHHIVSILEGVAITKNSVSNLCQDHDEPFTFFCRECEKNICSKCLSMIHRKHDFIEIRQFQSELKDKLRDILTEYEIEMKKKSDDGFLKYEEDCEKTLKKNFAIIDGRRNEIQMAVAGEREEIKKCMKSGTSQRLTNAKETKLKVQETHDRKIQTIRQQLQIQTATTINQFVKTSIVDLRRLTPWSQTYTRVNTFTSGGINQEQIRRMIGKFEGADQLSIPVQQEELDLTNVVLQELKMVRVYDLNVQTNCNSICCSPDGSIWIGSYGYVYKMTSDCLSILHQIPARNGYTFCSSNYYLTSLSSCHVVLSNGVPPYIDKFTYDGRRVDFTDLSPGMSFGIASTDKDEVIVSVSRKTRRSAMRSLKIFSNEGKKLNHIISLEHIDSLCIGSDDNLIICDGVSSYLTIIDRHSTVLKKMQTLAPLKRLTCDRYGNILGILYGGKAVYLISEDGQVERSVTVHYETSITDICIDRDNNLLILVERKKVIVVKYLE